jgi:DNA polymerase elongation subunit (family B)
MSYISAIRQGESVLVWERTDEGRELKMFDAPYYFYVKSNEGEHLSMYGDKLARFDFDRSREFHQAKQECESNGIEMFESDIPVELKVLSENYYGVEAPTLNVSFLDIEVDYNKQIGFSSVKNPYAPINSVAIYNQWQNRMIVLAIPPDDADCPIPELGAAKQDFYDKMEEISPFVEGVGVDIYFCRDEKDLLIRMIAEIEESDVLCGWNSDFFDIPYIGKRLELMGNRFFKMLSFPQAMKPSWRTIEKFGQDQEMLDLSGRVRLDYLELFKKYEVAERPSYKLESIADEVLPELPKLEYEGSLADLYRKDFAYFIRYNIRDTEILKGFEDRLGYVALANEMVHISTAKFEHVGGTLKLAELATINYCHHKLGGLVVNNLEVTENDSQIQGAFVLLPQVGLHQYIGSVDITSLYPSAIRALNISPETLRGQFTAKVNASKEIAKASYAKLVLIYEDGTEEERTAQEWVEVFKSRKWAVSGYGTVFDQTVKGIIPTILEDWFNQRKAFQKLMNEAYAGDDKQKAAYYNRLQYVYKIKLNSFYGALTNRFFRFYDLRLGESTTGSGRAILIHQCAEVAKVLDGEYMEPDRHVVIDDKEHFGYTDNWSIVYGDTDSSYFATHAKSKEEAIQIADAVGSMVNKSFPDFMRKTFLCNEGYDQRIVTGREVVTNKGIFVDKKRYILNIIDDEGKTVDKMKVMGLDTKKTTMPKEVSKELNTFVERLLKDEDWKIVSQDIVDYKDQLAGSEDVMSIGLPKGIKGIEDYTQKLKMYGDGQRLPGHVAAAILYNLCREKYEDKESPPIVSGMKIKVFYLTSKVGRFKSIAIPVDIDVVPSWFLNNFVIDKDAHIKRLVDNPLQNIIKAIGYEVPTKQGMLVDSLLEF